MQYEDLLTRFTKMSRRIFGENLVGIYLHGSLAMGCFNPKKSDLDLILIVWEDIPDGQKLEFLQNVVELNRQAPPKGLELSIIKRQYCDPFVYPTPFEFHFSPAHLALAQEDPEAYIQKLQGTDKDLGAHFTILNHYGVTLYGEQIRDVFGPVPAADYIDSIWFDVESARTEITENPMYVILNLCRVLAYLREEQVLSKETGGRWGAEKLPLPHSALADKALCCYKTDTEMTVKETEAAAFAGYMLAEIQKELQTRGMI